MSSSRIALCSWSLRPGDPARLREMLQELEVDAVQLALNPLLEEPPVWGRAVESLRETGIEVVSGMMAMKGEDYSTLESIARTGGVRPDDTWPDNLRRITKVAALAAEAHLRLVTFHAGFLPEDPGSPERRKLLNRLHLVADAFEPLGVGLALETGQERAATLRSVLEEFDREAIGVNFDPANMILYGMGDPIEALAELAPFVRQVHVKDAVATGMAGTWGREVPVGEGDVNWPAFFEIARSLDPPVDFVIEREARARRPADIVKARELISRFLGEQRA